MPVRETWWWLWPNGDIIAWPDAGRLIVEDLPVSSRLSAAMQLAVRAQVARPILILKLETTGGDVRVWSGIGNMTFNAEVYQGTGTMGSVSEIKETEDLRASGINLELTGVPSSMISTALGQMRQDKTVTLWLGLLDENFILVDTPKEMFSGLTDRVTIDEGPETSVISVAAESRMVRLRRPKIRRYTDQDQQQAHPGDRGFEYVAGLQDAKIFWGN